MLVIGATLGAKALAEGRRAHRALADLRETAPTFEAQAKALTGTGKLEDAIQKIGYAVKLAPDNADYRLIRANLLQAAQQLGEAAQDYRRVLALRPGDAVARTNLALCETLLAENGGRAALPPAVQSRLLDALLAQKRDLEAAPLAMLLRRDAQAMRGGVLARLAHYTQQPGWKDSRLTVLDGTFGLSLRGLQIGDLSVLQGLPFSSLEIAHTSFNDLRPLTGLPLSNLGVQWTTVSDLTPLRGMKLRWLDVYNTKVSDLTPLAGMPLERLILGFLPELADLSPLRGMPLKELNLDVSRKVVDLSPLAGAPIEVFVLSRTALRDISVLRGMPLRELDLGGSDAITDFSPLEHCATLERIKLPWDIRDIGFLSTLPKLKQVEMHGPNEPDRWIPAPDFLAAHAADAPAIVAARTALATLGVTNLSVRRIALDKDRALKLDLANTRFSNLAALQPLPVKSINLSATSVRDLSPLAEFGALEAVTLPPNAQGVERLRTLPKLRYLSLRWNSPAQRPEQTVAEFWKEFDAKRTSGK